MQDNPRTSDQSKPLPSLTQEELEQRSFHIQQLMITAQVRESAQPQFDMMSYTKYNETNEMADMSFIPPKKNKFDTRIVSGVTHEKDTSLLSWLQSFNFEVKIRAFNDKSEELMDLGDSLTALVRKSRQLENYDEKRPIFYRNLLVQGTSFTRERYVEHYVPKKLLKTADVDFTKLDTLKWKNVGFTKVYDGCVTEFVDGKKVFLQNIRETDIRKQARVFTIEYVPRTNAESMWGEMERWKSVPKIITPSGYGSISLGSIYSDWTFAEIDSEKIEVIEVFEPFDNTYQFYLNGVPMLPVGFPLTAISPSGCIPIAKGDLDPMNLFAYSKSIPAKTKIDQAELDEVLRLMIIKLRQSAFPPTGNNTDKVLSQDIFMPGKITPDIKKDDLSPLVPALGITQSDFSFYNLIQQAISDKSVSQAFEGQPGTTTSTATEYLEQQKKQMLKLGSTLDAVVNWEKQMAHLRVNNIIQNWTQEIDQTLDETRGKLVGIHRTIHVDDTFDEGQKGTRMIKFTTQNTMTPEEVYQQELDESDKKGSEIRYSYIDPELLRTMNLNFYYEIVPTDKNNDKLSQMMFVQNVTQAMNIFGPQSLNVEYLKKRFAQVMGEDFDKFFAKQPVMPETPQVGPDGKPLTTGVKMPENLNPTLKNVMQA